MKWKTHINEELTGGADLEYPNCTKGLCLLCNMKFNRRFS